MFIKKLPQKCLSSQYICFQMFYCMEEMLLISRVEMLDSRAVELPCISCVTELSIQRNRFGRRQMPALICWKDLSLRSFGLGQDNVKCVAFWPCPVLNHWLLKQHEKWALYQNLLCTFYMSITFYIYSMGLCVFRNIIPALECKTSRQPTFKYWKHSLFIACNAFFLFLFIY